MNLLAIFAAVLALLQSAVGHISSLQHVFKEASMLELRKDIKILNKVTSRQDGSKEALKYDVLDPGSWLAATAKLVSDHEVTFAIAEKNLDELSSILDRVSDPDHAEYGFHLTKEQIFSLTYNEEGYSAVVRFLNENGLTITYTSESRDYITARATVETWEYILNAHFYLLEQKDDSAYEADGHRFVRALEYHLPLEIAEHVTAAFGTVQLPIPRRRVHRATKSEGPRSKAQSTRGLFAAEGFVTPALINDFYNIPANTTGNSYTSQAVFESLGERFSYYDLELFCEQYDIKQQTVDVVIGGHNVTFCYNPNFCGESNLDIQYLMGIAQNVNTTYYWVSPYVSWGEWLVQVNAMAKPPRVFSVSYGQPEVTMSASDKTQFNTQAQKLSLMGVSLVIASGDDGAPGGVSSSVMCSYMPDFPSTSPYVTAVGATQGPEDNSAEIVCQGNEGGVVTSGGGFSAVFPQPSWQKDAVSAYFAQASPFKGFSASGRGYPDVSLLGKYYDVFINGTAHLVSGTSASAPVFSAMLSLVNSQRQKAGKSSLGWINPALYKMYNRTRGSFINDITTGHNRCTAYGMICCQQGFAAATGWDPASGLGSVNFTAFSQVFFALGNSSTRNPPYTPTAAPTVVGGTAPPTESASPTLSPSAFPTQNAGFAYFQTFSDSDCTGVIYQVQGFPTGKCIAERYQGSGALSGTSVIYECIDGGVTLTSFVDAACSSTFNQTVSRLYSGCNQQLSYYYSASYYSTNIFCSTSSQLPLPNADLANTDQYVTDMYFESLGCGDDITYFTAYKNKHCMVNTNGTSIYFDWPQVSVYVESGTCSGKGSRVTFDLDSTCTSTLVGPSASYYYYNNNDGQDDAYSYNYATFDDAYSTSTDSSANTRLCSNTTTNGVVCSSVVVDESNYMYYLGIGIIIVIVIAVLCCVGVSFFALFMLTKNKVVPSNIFFRQPAPGPAFVFTTPQVGQVQPVERSAMSGSVPLIAIRQGSQPVVRAFEDGTPPTFNPIMRKT